jgi:GT2 family glycosyltransferase
MAGDDIPHPTMIERLAGALEENEADVAYGDMFIVDDGGRILRTFNLPDYDFEACFANWYLCGVCKLFRRELLERVGFCDPKYKLANDYDLLLRFAMSGARLVHVPQVLYSVRAHRADRKVGLHSADNEKRLIAESIECLQRARAFRACQPAP